MELERISNDLEHANTVQERKGIIKEFRKTILDIRKEICTKSPIVLRLMYKDARTKIRYWLSSFMKHITKKMTTKESGTWLTIIGDTSKNCRRNYVGYRGRRGAGRKTGGIIREYVSDYDVIAFANGNRIDSVWKSRNQKHSTLKSITTPPSGFLEEHCSALRIPIDHRINYRSPLALIHVAWTAYNIIDAVEDDYSNSITIKLGDVIQLWGSWLVYSRVNVRNYTGCVLMIMRFPVKHTERVGHT
jgi:hypothetical protein